MSDAVLLEKLETLNLKADRIEAQTTKTNGRVTRLEFVVLGVTCLMAGLGVKYVFTLATAFI